MSEITTTRFVACSLQIEERLNKAPGANLRCPRCRVYTTVHNISASLGTETADRTACVKFFSFAIWQQKVWTALFPAQPPAVCPAYFRAPSRLPTTCSGRNENLFILREANPASLTGTFLCRVGTTFCVFKIRNCDQQFTINNSY